MDSLSSQSPDSLATAPPPPSEVKVRTMRSDLESMAKSGGGLPKFQNVKVSGLSMEKESASGIARTQSKNNLLTIIFAVVGLAVLGFGGWFAYAHFIASNPAAQTEQPAAVTSSPQKAQSNQVVLPAAPPAPAPAPSPAPAAPQVVAPSLPFKHVSFFKKLADQTMKWALSAPGAAQSASDLQTYSQKLLAFLGTANKNANFLEVDVSAADGHDLSIKELLDEQNAQVLDPQLLSASFNPDATFFVYRDKNGFWPGYVIGLGAGQDWSALKGSVQKIEASQNISNLFLTNAGTPSSAGFVDASIANSSARVLAFTGGSVPSTFVYGWTSDHRYLIISASQSGFAQAVAKL